LGDIGFGLTTSGDVTPDGRRVLLRNYDEARLFTRAAGQSFFNAIAAAGTEVPLADEPQGEGITWSPAADAYFTTSEGQDPPIYRYARQWPADANGDGRVNVTDLGILATNYNRTLPGPDKSKGDFNLNGRVDVNDLGILATDYGQPRGGAALSFGEALAAYPEHSQLVAGVPEPGGFILLSGLIIGVLSFGRGARLGS
jgi:hypothetical protein